MLAKLMMALGSGAIGSLVDSLSAPFKAYLNKEISQSELVERFLGTFTEWAGRVEIQHSQTIEKTFESFQVTLRGSTEIQKAWTVLFYTQVFVLVWHQIGIPVTTLLVRSWDAAFKYPSSGSTVEWSYLLLGFMLGAGSIILRNGPGSAPGGSMLSRAMDMIRSIRGK